MEPFGAARPSLGNKAIAEAIQKNIEIAGVPKWTEEEHKFARELQKSLNKKEEGLATKVAPLSASRQNSSSNDRRHHLGCAFGNSSLPVRYTRSSSAPLDGGDCPDHVDRAQGRGGRSKSDGGFGSRPAHFG
jgi:hypothetical protein